MVISKTLQMVPRRSCPKRSYLISTFVRFQVFGFGCCFFNGFLTGPNAPSHTNTAFTTLRTANPRTHLIQKMQRTTKLFHGCQNRDGFSHARKTKDIPPGFVNECQRSDRKWQKMNICHGWLLKQRHQIIQKPSRTIFVPKWMIISESESWHLYKRKKMENHSLTCSTKTRHGGLQFANMISWAAEKKTQHNHQNPIISLSTKHYHQTLSPRPNTS